MTTPPRIWRIGLVRDDTATPLTDRLIQLRRLFGDVDDAMTGREWAPTMYAVFGGGALGDYFALCGVDAMERLVDALEDIAEGNTATYQCTKTDICRRPRHIAVRALESLIPGART